MCTLRMNSSIMNTNAILSGDDAHIIYVNGQIKDNTPLGKLMHDFSCTDPEDMNYKELADRARYFKTDKEEQRYIKQKRQELQNEVILFFYVETSLSV